MNSIKVISLVFLTSLIITSCNKDLLESKSNSSQSILHFDSYKQMQDELSSVLKMSTESKSDWASQKGFSSFGVNADEFYNSINPDQFKSKEELVAFITNSKYLDLITDADGNQMVQTTACNNQYRYFINEDKIFTVEDKAVKVFGDISLITCIDNLEKLKQVQFVEEVTDNPDYEVLNKKEVVFKSTYPGCGVNYDAGPGSTASDGRTYRVVLHIWIEDNFNVFTSESKVETHYKLTSQRTTLGMFFNYENSITYNLHLTAHFINVFNNSQYHVFNLSGTQTCTVLEDSEVDYTANYNYNAQAHFDAFNCSAYVPQNVNVPSELYCN